MRLTGVADAGVSPPERGAERGATSVSSDWPLCSRLDTDSDPTRFVACRSIVLPNVKITAARDDLPAARTLLNIQKL